MSRTRLVNTLHAAAMAGDMGMLRALIARGHDVNGLDEEGTPPLFWAALTKKLAVAQILVEHGADVNFTGPNGTSPLHSALYRQNQELALWLLDNKANPLASDNNGNTMLHLASLNSLLTVVDRLLAQGVEVNALNSNGQSPLSLNLMMQQEPSEIPVSPVCALRLMEVGAVYDPVPWLGVSPMDFFVAHAAPESPFRKKLQKFLKKTTDEVLRVFVDSALQRPRPDASAQTSPGTPHGISPGTSPGAGPDTTGAASAVGDTHTHADRQQGGKPAEKPGCVQSTVLGPMERAEHTFLVSQPLAIPFCNNEMASISYDFDPKRDPEFLAEADRAVSAFLKLDDAFRLSLSEQVAEFAVLNLEEWDYSGYEAEDEEEWVGLCDMSIDEEWLDDFVAGEKAPEEVWRMLGTLLDVYVARDPGDNAVYVAIRWNCLWDVEHQFQLSFKEGRTLARVSANDGELTD